MRLTLFWWHILRHSPFIGNGLWFILECRHFRWFILGHSHFIHIHRARGFWFIWVVLRCFHFGTSSRDWLICWCTLCMVLLSSCWLGYTTLHWGIIGMESIFHWSITTLLDPLHWGISIFWREIKLILYVGASEKWYGDHWIISCCPHCILEHSHLVGRFDIETWLSIYVCWFW